MLDIKIKWILFHAAACIVKVNMGYSMSTKGLRSQSALVPVNYFLYALEKLFYIISYTSLSFSV